MIRVFVKTKTPEKLLTYLVKSGLDFYRPERCREGIVFEVAFFKKRSLVTRLEELCLLYEIEYSGIFALARAAKKSPGIIFGTLCALFLIYLSTFFVWGVKIEGAGDIPHSEILETLRVHGFEVGAKKKELDTKEIEQSFLADRSEFSFCSININGAVAHVELAKRIPERYSESETDPYNLVAENDGVVLALEVTRGLCTVEVGQTVFKGQLLVSGIVENTTNTGFRIARAEGRVFARVYHTLEFKVPLEFTEKRYVKEKNATAVRVLSKRFCLTRPPKDGDYDVITSTEVPELFGRELPISFEKIIYAFFVEKTETLTEGEALIKAHDMYRKTASVLFDTAVIEKEEFSHTMDENFLILQCQVETIENICKREKIEVN